MKRCNICKVKKSIDNFGKLSKSKDGYNSVCKECKREYRREYYRKNKKHILEMNKKHRDETNYNRRYFLLNKEKINEQNRQYYYKNKEIIIQKMLDKYKNNIQYKLSLNLRRRLCKLLRGWKSGSAVRDLGCSIEELKQYFESKFQFGMTWNNYGVYGWHIDHVKPLSKFDLTDRNQFLEACHFSNLQPMWAKENLSKSNKILVKF